MARKSRKQRQAAKTAKIQARKAKKVQSKVVQRVAAVTLEDFQVGLTLTEEFKLKEFLTNMLTERMSDVDKDLVDEVKSAIYDANYASLDRIAQAFPSYEVFKEFYEGNEGTYGGNTIDEKEALLEEILDYLK